MSEAPGTELAVILPVYNEGDAVEPVLRALSAGVRTPHELVVVYDFDGDTTVPVIARLTGDIPNLRGLRNDLGRGVLNAMKAGIAATTAPYVLISMADGSDEPKVVDPMVALARRRGRGVRVALHARRPPDRWAPPQAAMSRTAGLTLHGSPASRPTTRPTTSSSIRGASWTPSPSRAPPASSSPSSSR